MRHCPRCSRDIEIDFRPGAVFLCPRPQLGGCFVHEHFHSLYYEAHVTDPPRDPLLVEREKTHGSFAANAKISQMIKAIYKDYDYDERLPFEQREALDMIALKISRILSGQHNERDHWKDGSGYFKLGEEACDQTRSS